MPWEGEEPGAEPDSVPPAPRDASTRPPDPPASSGLIAGPWRGEWPLWRAFRHAVLPVGLACAAVVALVKLASWGLGGFSGWPANFVALGLVFLIPACVVWSVTALWRCAQHSRTPVRYAVRGAIVLAAGIATLQVVAFVAGAPDEYLVKARVHEAVNFSGPARTALAAACAQGSLREGMAHADLGLPPPGRYEGSYTRSVRAVVDGPSAARVIVAMKGIGGRVTEGQTVEYEGACSGGAITWRIGGTVPRRYLPKP